MATLTDYLTADDVAAAFGGTVDDPPQELIEMFDDPRTPTGELNEDKLAEVLARVNGMMDSKIAVKYALPLTVAAADADRVAATLRSYALALFRWMALRDKPGVAEAYSGVASAYKDAVAWLNCVADGTAFLGTSQTLPGAEARVESTVTGGDEKVFTRDRLKGW